MPRDLVCCKYEKRTDTALDPRGARARLMKYAGRSCWNQLEPKRNDAATPAR